MEEIKEKINKGFTIGRIPNKTYKWFTQFAKEEFCMDYGMALKHMCDVYQGLMPQGDEYIQAELDSLRNDLNALKEQINKQQEVKEEKLERVRLDGTRK